MSESSELKRCQFCGAPVVSEICPYCGNKTSLDTATASVEFPVLDCKEAHIGFWNVAFPAIFAVAFGTAGPITLFSGSEDKMVYLIALPFFLIGLVAAILTIRSIYRNFVRKKNGKKITGTVYGYTDDNIYLNGKPAQIMKILVQSPQGPRFIMYQLMDTQKTYVVNSTIDLIVYNNYFMVDKKMGKVRW